jgi:hypothetical protein
MGSVSYASQSAAEADGWVFRTRTDPSGATVVTAKALINHVGREVSGTSTAEVLANLGATESYRKDVAGKSDHKS